MAVFIPTTPSPVNGFYFYVRREDVIETDLSVDAALKYIVSMGVVTGGTNGRGIERPVASLPKAANQ